MSRLDEQHMQAWTERDHARAMDSVKERAEQAGDVNGELLWGCKWFIRLLADGVLVRDISKDSDPDWSMNMLRFVTALNRVNAAIFRAEHK